MGRTQKSIHRIIAISRGIRFENLTKIGFLMQIFKIWPGLQNFFSDFLTLLGPNKELRKYN